MIKKIRKLLYLAGLVLIVYNLVIASGHLMTGDLLFHTDIARDFLLVENIMVTGKLDLIGPRAGGIPGMFFGPIWYWIMLPILFLGNGSPIFIAYFWYILVALLVIVVLVVANRIFGKDTGFISAVLMSFYAFNLSHGFTQSFGSLLLSPVFFYLIYRFYLKKKLFYLIFALLSVGFVFQLQPAFAMLMLLITLILSIPFLIKIKKKRYIFSYLVLIIPLSTYIIFELRHNFLEINSFYNFIVNSPIDRQKIDFMEIIVNRAQGFVSRLNLLETGTSVLLYTLSFVAINVFIIFKAIREKVKGRAFYIIFYIYYFLFWVFSLAFKGIVWDFYHWAFLPLDVIIFSSLVNIINKKLFFIIFIPICIFLFNANSSSQNSWKNNFELKDTSSWLLNYKVASYIFDDSKNNFGYFVHSPDDLGYSMRYAMNYTQKFSSNRGNLCQKFPVTYLIYYPEIPTNSSSYWKDNKVKITGTPDESRQIGAIKIEKYSLDGRELALKADSNLLCDLSFR